jgi:hypothetical protein
VESFIIISQGYRRARSMLKQGYQVKAYNKATRKMTYYNYKDKANAQAKARELRRDPSIGISIYKVTRRGQ